MTDSVNFLSSCPLPLQDYPHLLLAHGGGGRLMHQLIEQMFLPSFGTDSQATHDAAQLDCPAGQLAFTTDSYVVSPLFFPGGDIGTMAVYGTVNDLAMVGARPLYLSLALILEEGLPMATLWQVIQSIQAAARQVGVRIVTGDTKVVDRGKGDGIYINTAGVGVIEHDQQIRPQSIQPGDAILLSGDLGRHGIAIMAQREGLAFETTLTSDLAPLAAPVQALLAAGLELHCLRDLTRGGLATALNELAIATQLPMTIHEDIPVEPAVRGACELLGLDPLYVANEGRFIAIVPPQSVAPALAILQAIAPDLAAQQIGWVGDRPTPSTMGWPLVTQQSQFGGARLLDFKSGEQLPRIC